MELFYLSAEYLSEITIETLLQSLAAVFVCWMLIGIASYYYWRMK